MPNILTIVAPVFLVMAAGFIAVRRKLIDQATIGTLAQFVLYFALPALIIQALSNGNLGEQLQPLFIAAYGGGALATYIAAFIVFRVMLGNAAALAGIKSFGSAFSNSAFIGYPLLVMVYDQPPVAIFAMALLFENVVLMPLVLISQEWMASAEHAINGRALAATIGRRICTNPIMIAIAIGVILAVTGLSLPAVIGNTLDLLGRASAGAALFFIGASLAGRQVGEHRGDALQIASFKLIVHPALVLLLLALLPAFDSDYQQAALLLAACPMLTIFPVISSQYGFTALASASLLVTTAASMLTISAVLLLAF